MIHVSNHPQEINKTIVIVNKVAIQSDFALAVANQVGEVRKQAMQGDLIDDWAKADAHGIAKGFGILNSYE